MSLSPTIKPDDWPALNRVIQKLTTLRLGPTATPTFASLTLSDLTASRLMATDASKVLVSSDLVNWVTGTTNRVTVSDDGDGTITLTGPQDLHTGADPTFNDLTLTGTLTVETIDSDTNEIDPAAADTIMLGLTNKFSAIYSTNFTGINVKPSGLELFVGVAGSAVSFRALGGVALITTPVASGANLRINADGAGTVNLEGTIFNNAAVTTTGLGTFGNLDVDTLNLNGNVISDSTGTILFDNDHTATLGDVGIGTVTLNEKLNIFGDKAKLVIIDSTDTSTFVKVGIIRPGGFSFGGIWFNQAAPSATNYAFMFDGSSTLFNSPLQIDYRIGNSQKMRLANNGNFLIGTTTDGGELLQVAGDARFDGIVETSSGRVINRTSVTSSPYTVLASDYHISVTTASTAITLNLPAIGDGTVYHVKDQDENSSGNNITLSPDGSDTIENAASLTINTNGASVTLVGNSATNNWEIQ